MLNFFKRALFPERCLGCFAWDTLLCRVCARLLLAPGSLSAGDAAADAANTASAIAPLTSLSWFMSYELEPVRVLIQQLKFQGVRRLARKIIYPPWPPVGIDDFRAGAVLMPIPLHPMRLRERGFNQSVLIAQTLASQYRVPLLDSVLVRRKNTVPQSSLSHDARPGNVSGAFALRCPVPARVQRVIFVDDVWTSGSTIKEAARVVRSSSSCLVSGLVIAYAGDHGGDHLDTH